MDRVFNYRKIVGNKAEKLIKEMFEELGFEVFNFGYEHLFPQLFNCGKKLKGQAGDFVMGLPDFLLVDRKTKEAFLIEVKCRMDGVLDSEQVSEIPESWVILVAPGKISIALAEDVVDDFNDEYFCYLNEEPSPFINKDKRIILEYVRKTKEIWHSFS